MISELRRSINNFPNHTCANIFYRKTSKNCTAINYSYTVPRNVIKQTIIIVTDIFFFFFTISLFFSWLRSRFLQAYCKCAHSSKREEDSAGLLISIDLNRESILTDTNDVTLTLKTIRIEFFPIFLWFSNFQIRSCFISNFFLSFNVVLCYRRGVLYKLRIRNTFTYLFPLAA